MTDKSKTSALITLDEEVYDISGHEGSYGITKSGLVYSHINNKFLKTRYDKNGYNRIGLCVSGKKKHYRVARLVAKTFLKNEKEKAQVNHINGIRNDDRVENLEWVTPKENVRHAYAVLGRVSSLKGRTGRECSSSKIVYQYDVQNGKVIDCFFSTREAERKTGIQHVSINNCCNNKLKTAGGYFWRY